MSGNKERRVDICPHCRGIPDTFYLFLIRDELTSTLIGWLHQETITHRNQSYKAEVSGVYRRTVRYVDLSIIPNYSIEVRCADCGFLPRLLGIKVWERFKKYAEKGLIFVPPGSGYF